MDGDVNDIKYHRVYNDNWQQVAVYRADDDDPKELFLYHQAGLDGSGGSSYIDAVVLRQKNDNSGWTNAADGTLEQRYYYCQNWRADVVAIVTSAGKMMEWVKYSAYGVPYGLPAGDTDSNAVTNQTDVDNIDAGPAYDVRYDANLDGSITAADSSRVSTNFLGVSLGWDALTNSAVGNRRGYAGYEFDEAVSKYHVRNRVLDSHLGRWTRRDPLGYVDGMNVYEYVGSSAINATDSKGTECDLFGTQYPDDWDGNKTATDLKCDVVCKKLGGAGQSVCTDKDKLLCCACTGNLDKLIRRKAPRYPIGSKISRILGICALKHEACHGDDGGSCPSPDGDGGALISRTDIPCSECKCYGAEIECVKGVECNGSKMCESILAARLKSLEASQKRNCDICKKFGDTWSGEIDSKK